MRFGSFAVLGALSLFGHPAASAAVLAECDRLAASPDDPARTATAINVGDINGETAEKACRKALKKSPDVARFRFQLGRALEAQQDYEGAMAAYQAAFDQGYAAAADAAGMLYELGLGREADYRKAAEFYQKALGAGDVFAASDLDSLHEEGEGFPKDASAAAALYRKAANAGYAAAQVHLGYLYDDGDGVAEDAREAVAWYQKAVAQGSYLGQFDLALMYADGRGVGKDLKEATRLLKLSADQNYGFAILELARYARDGTGRAADKAEAEKLFRQAIDAGDEDAMWQAENELADMWAHAGTNLVEAANTAERALYSVPDPGEDRSMVLDTNAWIAHLRHNDAKALPLEEEAIKGDAKYAPYHDHLGDMLLALGRKAEAADAWKTALRLDPPDASDGWDRPAVIKKLGALQPPTEASPAGDGRDSTDATISPVR